MCSDPAGIPSFRNDVPWQSFMWCKTKGLPRMTREEVQMETSLYCAWFGTDSRFQADVNPNTPAYFYSVMQASGEFRAGPGAGRFWLEVR